VSFGRLREVVRSLDVSFGRLREVVRSLDVSFGRLREVVRCRVYVCWLVNNICSSW